MSFGESRVDIGSFFGYSHFVRRPTLAAMVGDTKRLEVGMIVRLKADSEGYIREFNDGDSVVIVGFRPPDVDGNTDYVILASDGTRVGVVKPHRIERILMQAPRELR